VDAEILVVSESDAELFIETGDVLVVTQPELQILDVVEQGPPGAPGGSYYQYIQSAAASTWVVNHNFGKYPAVTVYSVGGKEMLAEVVHVSTNQVLVMFDTPMTGRVICS
jgi:hypothetical protein